MTNLKSVLQSSYNNELTNISINPDTLEEFYLLLDKSISDNPTISLNAGGLVKEDYNIVLLIYITY